MTMDEHKMIDLEQEWKEISVSKLIDLQQGLEFVEKGITKAKYIAEGLPERQFSSKDYMILYSTIYTMCIQDPPHQYSHQLYGKYRESLEEYIISTVVPSLGQNEGEFMLRVLARSWEKYNLMVRSLSRFFGYLDRHFIEKNSLPSLYEVAMSVFRDLVYKELKGKVRDIVISMIDGEGEEEQGEQIDRASLKNVLDVLVGIGMGRVDYNENDFEAAKLREKVRKELQSVCLNEVQNQALRSGGKRDILEPANSSMGKRVKNTYELQSTARPRKIIYPVARYPVTSPPANNQRSYPRVTSRFIEDINEVLGKAG